MARATTKSRRRGGRPNGRAAPGRRFPTRRQLPWWQAALRSIRRASWTLKLVTIGIVILVGFPLFSAIDTATPRRIQQRGGLWVCDLRTLSDFEIDQVHGRTEDIPKQFRELDGRRVELVGQMWAPLRADGRVRDFDLVYSIANCCFSGAPKVQHIVKATVRDGRTVEYCPGRVDVKGTLHVGVQADAEGIESVYRVDVDSATPG